MSVMTKTIQAVLAAKAAKAAEEAAAAARVAKTIKDAIDKTTDAVAELNNVKYRITKMPQIGNTTADSERVRADGFRLWFMWVGSGLVALTDHSELLGPYNQRPIRAERGAHIPYEEVKDWAMAIYGKDGHFTPCNGEGVTVCTVSAEGRFVMGLPGTTNGPRLDADQAMQKAAEWLASIMEPDSFAAPS